MNSLSIYSSEISSVIDAFSSSAAVVVVPDVLISFDAHIGRIEFR